MLPLTVLKFSEPRQSERPMRAVIEPLTAVAVANRAVDKMQQER